MHALNCYFSFSLENLNTYMHPNFCASQYVLRWCYSFCYKSVHSFRVTCLFSGQYNTKGLWHNYRCYIVIDWRQGTVVLGVNIATILKVGKSDINLSNYHLWLVRLVNIPSPLSPKSPSLQDKLEVLLSHRTTLGVPHTILIVKVFS